MTPPSLARPALGLAAVLLLALAGCGKTEPTKDANKGKDTPRPDPVLSVPNPGANPTPGPPAAPPGPTVIDPKGPLQLTAETPQTAEHVPQDVAVPGYASDYDRPSSSLPSEDRLE